MKERTVRIFNKVFQKNSIDEIFEFAAILQFYRELSVFNALMVYTQREGASCFIYTESKWNKRFQRKIKLEAKPIIILEPFAPIEFLYEPNDTYGDKPLPEYMKVRPEIPQNDISNGAYANIVSKLYLYGVKVIEEEFGDRQFGVSSLLDVKEKVSILKRIKTDKGYEYKNKEYVIKYLIRINNKHNAQVKFSTLMHELGHILCDHLFDKEKKNTRFNINDDAKEIEAETVAKFICDKFGIKNNSDKYLKEHRKDKINSDVNIDIVIHKADHIIRTLDLNNCFLR